MPFITTRPLLVLLLSLWGLLISCVTPGNPATQDSKPRQSFLWEAQKGDLKLTLVGTMHIGIREEDMDPQLWERLKAADTVIIETDIAGARPEVMSRYMTLPPGSPLRSLLGASYWDKLLKVTKASGSPLGETQLDRLSPLAVGALLLQIQAKADEDIAQGQVSIDQVIYERGKSLGKKLRTLETNEEQLESLKAVFSIAAIQKVLDEWDSEGDSYAQMKKAFKEGDSGALDELLEEVPEEMRVLLLEKRNINWIKKLPELQGRNTVLAVGAAHYPGPSGLLELLEKEGYRIKRLQ